MANKRTLLIAQALDNHPLERVDPRSGLPPEYREELATVREAVLECVTVEQLRGIIEVQIEKALQGSDFSAKFIFDRYFGAVTTQRVVNKTTNTTNNTVQVVDLAKFTPEQLLQLQEMKKAIESKPSVEETEDSE